MPAALLDQALPGVYKDDRKERNPILCGVPAETWSSAERAARQNTVVSDAAAGAPLTWQYTRNMVTGTSTADPSLLVVIARRA
jgi:hypothetical protein